jgi:glycosyltransferase involved in cell wall biosynthesis
MPTRTLTGRDIVCLASQSWESHWCTPQQISSRLAGHNRVLYVEPMRSPLWWIRRSATHTRRPSGAPTEVMPNVWLLTLPPVFIPIDAYRRAPWLRHLNNRLCSLLVGRAMRQLGFHKAIAWVYLITVADAPLLRSADAVVYDCIDEWSGATEDPREKRFFTDLDRRLCRCADVLFVGSRSLAENRRDLHPRMALVPQGVDLAHFLPSGSAAAPPDLAALARPIIGLVGVLNRERIDIDLLCHLAEQRPNWSIVLVGPVWKGLDTERLARFANIHLLGNKPREQLGRYIEAFDVCMLPYLINDFTRNIFPLKLFEYLASGKPFVATPIPACAEFPRLIRTADGPVAFLAQLEEAMRDDTPALRDERIALARENDWDRRTADKARVVAAWLARRRPATAPRNMRIEEGTVDA